MNPLTLRALALAACFGIVLVLQAERGGAGPSPPEHPYLFFTEEDIPRLRMKAEDAGDTGFGFSTKSAWETIRKRADFFLTAPSFHYEVTLPSGDAWSYTMSDATPPPHPKDPSYPPWTAMFQEHDDSITTRIKTLTLAYVITGQASYADAAKKIVLELCNWTLWTDASFKGCYSAETPACLDTGHATQTVAAFYDWTYPILTQPERGVIVHSLIEKGILPLRERIKAGANHNGLAVFNTGLGIGALALIQEDPRAEGWLDEAITNVGDGLDAEGKDGGTFEGFTYGTYLTDNFARFLDALRSSETPHDLLEHPFYRTLTAFAVDFLSPQDAFHPTIGDAPFTRGFPEALMVLAQRGDPYATWYLRRIGVLKPTGIIQPVLGLVGIGEPYNFIRFDPERLEEREPVWNPSSVFQDIGYGVLHDGFARSSPYLAFKSGPPHAAIGHNHLDHNSFVINYLGQWLATDPGARNRSTTALLRFTETTLGHNSVLVDDEDQKHLAGGLISDFFSARSYDFIKGRAAEVYDPPLENFDRAVVYVKPSYFVIYDELAAPAAHAYSYLLHTDRAGIIEERPEGILLKKPGAQLRNWVFSPAGLTRRITTYEGAEAYGPYLEAKTGQAVRTSILSVLYPQPSPDLLLNPGFELDLAGWTPRAQANHSVDTTEAHSGTKSGRISFEEKFSGYFYSGRFALPPGSPVAVTGYIKTGTPDCDKGSGARLRILYWKNDVYLSDAHGPFAVPTDWTPFTVSSLVPADTDEISVALEFLDCSGTAWFDTVSIASPATPRASPEPVVTPVAEGRDGAAIATGDQYDLVLFNPQGKLKTVRAGGESVRTDGEVVVISRNRRDRLLSLTVQKGTRVRLDRTLLLWSARRAVTSVLYEGTRLHITAAGDTEHPVDYRLSGPLVIYTPQNVAEVVVNHKRAGWFRAGHYVIVYQSG